MQGVIDFSERGLDGAPLTATETDGLLGRPLLADRPLVTYLRAAEQPQFCLWNHRNGVVVEGRQAYRPDRWHAGVALLTDCRILFAVGRTDGDRTIPVGLSDVRDVSIENRLLGETLLVETADTTYRFPCWGNLDPVRERASQLVETWRTAGDHLDRARRILDRLEERIGRGDGSGTCSLFETVEDELDTASEIISSSPGADAVLGEEITTVRNDLTALRRQAHATRADHLFERAERRWDDRKLEAAFDDLEAARDAYSRAIEVDAEKPSDEELIQRRDTVLADRRRLASAPLEAAEFAREVAAATEDPEAAIRWWKTTMNRYEIVYTLDWGRDRPRFDVDREKARDALEAAVRNLVEAYCRGACEYANENVATHRSDTQTPPDRATELLDGADALARERVPDMREDVRSLRNDIIPEESTTDGRLPGSGVTADDR
ncbi:hypothetical protein [Halorhabdus amylolytica]|uniref:hypothetical protein n=1 Tax=Halorhabdus amylolytica TaxID=2559573 RepID=UPI0010AAB092|nr:hypothetical protein [Halorhabdus amylolytica]